MKMPKRMTLLFWLCILGFSGMMPARAQAPCGVVDSIGFPIDTHTFMLVQDFSAPSERHQGRFHTGEDWYGGRDTSYGQPVHAIARGRVKYADRLAWGRDGGVVIIEHVMPDNSLLYSQYGHLMETDAVQFPEKFGCVEAGDVIGVVADARPAPHTHFEIRINQPDTPGPGYTWEPPFTLGWRQPSKHVTNWQTWLLPSHRWHINTAILPPPLVLNDSSIMYLDSTNTLRRATADGRILWRVTLEKAAVSITGYQGNPLLIYADGAVQYVSYEGALGESWTIPGLQVEGAPLDLGDGLLFHTPDNALVAIDRDRRAIRWRLDDVPPFVRGQVTGQVIALITASHEMLVISRDGRLLDRAQLRGMASLSVMPDNGALLVYSHGGLWTVNENGEWAFALAWASSIPPGGASGAALMDGLTRVYVFDGQSVHAYERDSSLTWQTPVPEISGMTQLAKYGSVLLLTSTHGDIIALSEAGAICARTQIYGDDRTHAWQALGSDGILRLAVADQILGMDWPQFTRGC